MLPLLILGGLVVSALFAPFVAPHSPVETDLTNSLAPPFLAEGGSTSNLLGTDRLGRDVLSRVIHGGRTSLFVAFTVLLLGGTAGTVLGLVSGYVGGRVDAVVQKAVEAVLSLPTIMVAFVFIFFMGQGFGTVIVVLAPFVAAQFARMVRGDTIAIRSEPYIALAQIAGASSARVIATHLLPNVAATVIVVATLELGNLILVEAALSFLGVGVPPPAPAWGLMISEGTEYLSSRPWLALVPGAAIVAAVLSINWIGDWLRDALDPKSHGR